MRGKAQPSRATSSDQDIDRLRNDAALRLFATEGRGLYVRVSLSEAIDIILHPFTPLWLAVSTFSIYTYYKDEKKVCIHTFSVVPKKTYLALVPLTKELLRMMVSDMPGHLIRRLNQMSTQVFSQRTQDAGQDLTPVQFAALDAVHSHPGLDQAGIAARIAYDKATIGGVIDRLEQKGLVTRSISARDRRAREVKLTQNGHRTYLNVLPIVSAIQEEILGALNKEEQTEFLRLAKKAIHKASTL